ncbi:DUF1269 domain-containing protein [Leifsonia xyli]|uniref:DUF1269 domain-containing protein n=1 Tax=Leifsonia xyli TaxID=1575 RepID=UPI003D66D772
MAADKNLVLVVGAYTDAAAASSDYAALKAGEDDGDYKVDGAVVMSRDAEGKVSVTEHDTGKVGRGAGIGAGAGIVVGLFAPPLLLATALGAGIGAGIGALQKRHDEKKLGVDLDEYLPPGSSAVVAVVDDTWADKVEEALVKADKRIAKAIDQDDYEKLQEAIAKSEEEVSKAANS